MLVYFLLLCFCSGLTWASYPADHDALLDSTEVNSSEDEGSDSEFWRSKIEYDLPSTYPRLRESVNISAGSTRRIVGGRATSVHRFPYTVAILRSGDLWCGGALIEASWVLTAAHCLKDVYGPNHQRRVMSFKIRAGSSHPDRGGILAQISRAFFPRQYRPFLANFDYSLLQLQKELPLGDGISLVRLPPRRSEVEEGKHIVVTGWGSTAPSGQGQLPNRLRYVTIPILARRLCQRHYYFPITANMICASYPEGGMDACNHDSGGPATYNGYLVGIVSFGGRLCGDPKSPGVYSRVSKATNWVKQVIEQISGRSPKSDSNVHKRKRKKKYTHQPTNPPTHQPPVQKFTKRSSRESVVKQIGAKIINGPLKERYTFRYNTGIYIKKIGEERKFMEYEPNLRIDEFTDENQERDELFDYTKVPIRKGYGRRRNFVNAYTSNNLSRDAFINVIETTDTQNLTAKRNAKLTKISATAEENQDERNVAVDSVAHSTLEMRRIHKPRIITIDDHNGTTTSISTSDSNEPDSSIWRG